MEREVLLGFFSEVQDGKCRTVRSVDIFQRRETKLAFRERSKMEELNSLL